MKLVKLLLGWLQGHLAEKLSSRLSQAQVVIVALSDELGRNVRIARQKIYIGHEEERANHSGLREMFHCHSVFFLHTEVPVAGQIQN